MVQALFRMIFFFCLCVLFLPQAAGSEELEQHEGYVTSHDGVRLFFKVTGQGPDPLVILHGGPGNTMESIRPDLEPLEADHTLIYYDQRGNGRSDLLDEDKDLAVPNHIKDLESIRQHFKLDKLNLLGNSWGGLLASLYALDHPDKVEKMILLSPASPSFELLEASNNHIHMRIPDSDRDRFNSLSIPQKWLTTPRPREICRSFYEILVPVYFTDPEKARDMRGDTCAAPIPALRRQQIVNKQIWHSLEQWDIRNDLARIKARVLIIHGSDDMIPLDSSRAWVNSFPNARLLVIHDSGHMTHIEQPEVFFTGVNLFLQDKWPEGVIDSDAQTAPQF